MRAEALRVFGYSVIPLWGDADPDRAKVAAVEWGVYQCRKPTRGELSHWFDKAGFNALAIVCGLISRVAVLDFDDEDLFKIFRAECPDLAERYVVKTRRGYHIYFHVPPHLNLRNRKLRGIDLLWQGRYAVAPLSVINGHRYRFVKGGLPKELTERDIPRIMTFLDTMEAAETAVQQVAPPPVVLQSEPAQPMTVTDLPGLFAYLVIKLGSRNEALFQTSLQARDSGVEQTATVAALVDRFINTLHADGHPPETPRQRRKEALATIASAYSRAPRQRAGVHFRQQLIPNSVAEALDQSGQTVAVRALNGLRLQGVFPGFTFTRSQLLQLLKGTVGRNSLDAALKHVTPTGQRLFELVVSPPDPPLAPKGAARLADQPETNNCVIGREQKAGKIHRGRKEHRYRMPSNDDLCQRLGLPVSRGSDLMTLDDLVSSKNTRKSRLRELITRRPGKYPRRWLAQLLGVTVRTLRTYIKELDIQVVATYRECPVYWSNLDSLPTEALVNGVFLEDNWGKRYPPLRSIAAKLLARKRALVYRKQDVNYYALGKRHEAVLHAHRLTEQEQTVAAPMPAAAQPSNGHSVSPSASGIGTAKPANKGHAQSKAQAQKKSPPPAQQAKAGRKRSSKRLYRKPLADASAETLAQRVYSTINAQTTDKAALISLVSARKYVDRYGIGAIERALKLMAQRRNIVKPVGFFATVLRGEALRLWLQAQT
jgi:hypothetical protein